MLRCVVLASLTLLASGCDIVELRVDSTSVFVRLASDRFQLPGPGLTVRVAFTVRNTGTADVWVAQCEGRIMAALDRYQGGTWVRGSSDACPAGQLLGPVRLAPGASRASTMEVGAPGVYRLRPGLSDAARDAPQWDRAASSSFEIR